MEDFCETNNLWREKTHLIPEDCVIPIDLYEGIGMINIMSDEALFLQKIDNKEIRFLSRKDTNKGLVVKFTISTFIGLCSNASHYYGSFNINTIKGEYFNERYKTKAYLTSNDPLFKTGFALNYTEAIGDEYEWKYSFNSKNILIENATRWFEKHFEKGWVLNIDDKTW